MRALLGHERPIAQLRRAVAGGRMHHAWILSGPVGVGKRLVALEAAKWLLDDEAPRGADGAPDPDPASRVSRAIDGGTHPDVRIITKELAAQSDDAEIRRRKLTNLPLDVLRQFLIGGTNSSGRSYQGAAYLTSQEGRGKVFIIDEAELIDATGQNALLKTLEEPPPQTWFFLLSTAPQRLLPTVHSRCQHVRFGPLSDADMRSWLDRALPELDEPARAALLTYADGSPGLALLAHEAEIPRWSQQIGAMLSAAESGRVVPELARTLIEFTESFAESRVKGQANASKDAANKEASGHLFRMLAARSQLILHAAAQEGDDPEPIIARLQMLRDAELQLASNVNLKQVLEALALRWSESAMARR